MCDLGWEADTEICSVNARGVTSRERHTTDKGQTLEGIYSTTVCTRSFRDQAKHIFSGNSMVCRCLPITARRRAFIQTRLQVQHRMSLETMHSAIPSARLLQVESAPATRQYRLKVLSSEVELLFNCVKDNGNTRGVWPISSDGNRMRQVRFMQAADSINHKRYSEKFLEAASQVKMRYISKENDYERPGTCR